MSPELIAAVAAALVALIGAVSTFASRRSLRQADELVALRAENEALRKSNGAYLRQRRLTDQWIGRVVRVLDLSGTPIPEPPEGLFDDAFPHARTAPSGGDPAGGAHRAETP